MAINKAKKKLIQISFPHKEAEQLDVIVNAFNESGVSVTKSDILLVAFRGYVDTLLIADKLSKKKVEEPQKENKDA